MEKRTLGRQAANVALAGTLAVSGAMAIAGVQALAPDAARLVQKAQAKTEQIDNYTTVVNHQGFGSCTHSVKIVGGKLKSVHGSWNSAKGGRINNIKSSYRISPHCSYYKDFKVVNSKKKGVNFTVKYSKKTTKATTLGRLKKANVKRSLYYSGDGWQVAFRLKGNQVVKIAVCPS